jgi:hypothetical protein
MTGTLTPGAYLKRCRQRAGLSVADVAARMSTEPKTPEHLRGEWLELIEADAMPATFATIVSLRLAYRFDLTLLAQLAAIALGADLPAPILCRICACSDGDACMDALGCACSWAEPDLCSACATPPAASVVQ